MTIKLEKQLVGIAGEYLVAGELSLRGYIASITLRNSRGIDILASNAEGTLSVSIQVKTNSSGSKHWQLTNKSEDFFSDNHFYVFVSLGTIGQRPSFHIVPSTVVAKTIKTGHETWLKGTKKNGESRKDSSIRKFSDKSDEFIEAWDSLKL